MPWVRADLRGQLVYARADDKGALLADSGRVEIRYKPNDGRAYRAAESNLTVRDATLLPDSTCDEADSPGKSKGAAKPKKASKKRGAKKAVAPPVLPAGTVIAYTDGACSGNPGPAGLGVVVLLEGERIELFEYLGEGTNNIAELTAILRALEELEAGKPAAIHTDSQYSIGVVQKGWKAKKNQALVAALRSALAAHGSCTLVYVKGHAGIPLNERADELARLAVETRETHREVVPEEESTSLQMT
jgi:ribonuclease HI